MNKHITDKRANSYGLVFTVRLSVHLSVTLLYDVYKTDLQTTKA